MNRICPSEETLSEYLYGKLAGEERDRVEQHISGCEVCRKTLGEAYDVLESLRMARRVKGLSRKVTENIWLLVFLVLFGASFVVPRYFFQFLSASLLAGIKWILGAKATRTLIMINQSQKAAAFSDKTVSKKADI